MEFLQSVFFEPSRLFEEETVRIFCIDDQELIVEKYLNEWALIGSRPIETENKMKDSEVETKGNQITQALQSKGKNKMTSTKNSIFHNFQKHLITVIKKLIQINELTFEGFESSELAVELWQTFVRGRSQSKKIFQVIFGMAGQGRDKEELDKLVDMFPQFKKLLAQHSIEEIECAQQLIRIEVASQGHKLSKVEIFSKCRVHKWEEFYQYFKTFVHQLFMGQITGRISKKQKQILIVSLYTESKLV